MSRRRQSPVFVKVHERLRGILRSGAYPSGALLPSEKALREECACSRTSIRKCLTKLAEEGLIEPVKGRGWMVKGREDVSMSTPVRHIAILNSLEDHIGAVIAENMRTFLPGSTRIEFIDSQARKIPRHFGVCREIIASIEADALVLIGNRPVEKGTLQVCVERPFPVICAGLNELGALDAVSTDFHGAVRNLTHLAVADGHRSILFLKRDLLMTVLPSFGDRQAGYLRGMYENELEPDILDTSMSKLFAESVSGHSELLAALNAENGAGVRPSCVISGIGVSLPIMQILMKRAGRACDFYAIGSVPSDMDQEIRLDSIRKMVYCGDNWPAIGQQVASRLAWRWRHPNLAPILTTVPALYYENSDPVDIYPPEMESYYDQ